MTVGDTSHVCPPDPGLASSQTMTSDSLGRKGIPVGPQRKRDHSQRRPHNIFTIGDLCHHSHGMEQGLCWERPTSPNGLSLLQGCKQSSWQRRQGMQC